VLIDDYSYGRVAEMDSANPTISLTSPASGTYGKGSLPIAGSGTDDLAVKAFVALLEGTSNYLPATAGVVNTTIDTSGVTAGGPYTLTVYALDYANKKSGNETRNITLTNVAAGPLVFTNSDFEADIPGALDTAFSYSSTAFAGSRSIRFSTNFINAGSVTTRTYALSGVNNMFTNENYKYLTFMFRGTVAGTNPGLRFQVSAGLTIINYYDINGITSGSTWTVAPNTGGTFSSTPINVTEWTKVRLDLNGVNWNSLNITQYPLRFRARQQTSTQDQTQHDWLIDDVRFEN
jgi:hypothetical protein